MYIYMYRTRQNCLDVCTHGRLRQQQRYLTQQQPACRYDSKSRLLGVRVAVCCRVLQQLRVPLVLQCVSRVL